MQPRCNSLTQNFASHHFLATQFLLLCITWESYIITVRNKKKNIQQVISSSTIDVLLYPKYYNSTILPTWLVSTLYIYVGKWVHTKVKSAISDLFYLLGYNLICLSSRVYKKSCAIPVCYFVVINKGTREVGEKNDNVWHRGKKSHF